MMEVYFLSSSFAHYISKFIANATITGSDEVPEPGFMTTMIKMLQVLLEQQLTQLLKVFNHY